MSTLMPAIFFGHGNPMNAVQENAFTQSWEAIGTRMARPRAILCVSAHWYIGESAVTINTPPRTIHDFGGFPPELYAVQYPAPGDAELAARVHSLLAPVPVSLDESWGLDHGTWSVLCHVFPEADVPVVQLSIDARQPAAFHYQLGQRLAPLREEGVLMMGSGNLVHNLRAYAWGEDNTEPYDWAVEFESRARDLLQAGEYAPLIDYQQKLGREALLAIPTPDHYLPLLYVLGARSGREAVSFPVEGIEGGSISMLAVRLG
jgi:4,5-DOPA dioxygenase extradiol